MKFSLHPRLVINKKNKKLQPCFLVIFLFILFYSKSVSQTAQAQTYRIPSYSNKTEPYEACLIEQNTHYNNFPIIFEPDRFKEVTLEGKKVSLSPHAQLVASLTKEQGYEVHCASLPWNITHFLIDEGGAKHFYENYDGVYTLGSCGSYLLSASDAKVPVYRSNEECLENNHKASSYEAFFGSMTPNQFPSFWPENTSPQNPIASGVANHLLTASQQCKIKVDNLETIAFYCNNLAPNEQWCYLNRPIANSKYDILTLYGVLHQYIHAYRDQYGNPITCEDIMGTWENLVEQKPWAIQDNNLTETIYEDIQTAINNVGFNIENLYRTAFLVISFGQDYWEDENDIASLTTKTRLTQDEHAPLIFVFKIPHFLNNESRFDDAAKITRQTLSSQAQQDAQEQIKDEKKDGLFKKALARSTGERFIQGDPIYCPSLPECSPKTGLVKTEIKKEPITGKNLPVTQVTENTIVRNAIIDIINGHHSDTPECEPVIFEEAGDIFTSAKLEIEERGQFISEQTAFYPSLEEVAETSKEFDWRFEVKNFDEYLEGFEFDDNQDLPVRAWIVAPLGIEQEHVFEVLQGAFFTAEQQEQMLEENIVVDTKIDGQYVTGQYPKYFTFKDVNYGLTFTDKECSNQAMIRYPDWKFPVEYEVTICDWINDEELTCWEEKRSNIRGREFGKGITEDKPTHLNIFGALVGWSIRKIQESIYSKDTPWHDYFASCERVEDMFLGRCGLETNESFIFSQSQWEPVLDLNDQPITLSFDTAKGKCEGSLIKFVE